MSAAFDGTLNLEQDGLSLAVGQTFDLFAFASETGAFQSLAVDGVGLVSLGAGQWAFGSLILQEAWTPSTFRIDVLAGPSSVPEIDPSGLGSVLAFAGAAFGLLERSRSRANQST